MTASVPPSAGTPASWRACARTTSPAEVIAEVVKRNGVKPEDISDVILGCVTQAGEDCRNVARFATLMAGIAAHRCPA